MNSRFSRTIAAWAMGLALAAAGLQGDAYAKLIDNGHGLIFDTVLNITWSQDANLCVTLGNCVNGTPSGMTWNDANTWANSLVFGGVSGWRLPYASVAQGRGPANLPLGQPCTGAGGADENACRDNEMAYMFYYNLVGTYFGDPKTGDQIADGVTLTHIQVVYYSGTLSAQFAGDVVSFDFFNGFQSVVGDGTFGARFPAWAVHAGDVTAVPEPSGLPLIAIAALGAFVVARRRVPQRLVGA